MTDSKKPAGSAAELIAHINKFAAQSAANAAAEAARRARMTPEQRAAETQAGQMAKLLKLGPGILARESMTIADFAWLLIGERPGQLGFAFFEREDADQKQHRAVLESCVGRSLHALNPGAPTTELRYPIEDLLEVARSKSLGWHVALASVLAHSSSGGPPRVALRTGREAADTPMGPVVGGYVTAPAPVFPERPASLADRFSPEADRSALETHQLSSPENDRSAPVQRRSRPDTPSGPSLPKPWHVALGDVLQAIERGARTLDRPVTRHELPESTKQLSALLQILCAERGIAPPSSVHAIHKQLQRTQWGFGGAGHKSLDGSLRALAVAGGLTELKLGPRTAK